MSIRFTRFTMLMTFGASLSVLLGALSMAQDNAAKPKTAKEQYKNIKVLKDLPADQLIPVMRNINNVLGVRCDHCHVINPDHTGFEKDVKPAKETCRKMILMVNDMNKRFKALDGKANCFICHRGHAKPEGPGSESKPSK